MSAIVKMKINWMLQLIVTLPTLLAIVYFGFVAENIYTSEATYIIRSSDTQSSLGGLGSFFSKVGVSRSNDDSYVILSYIKSRDALSSIEKFLPIQNWYTQKGDVISRFNGFNLDFYNKKEYFYRYMNDMISVNFDSSTGIATISVNAFDARDAFAINEQLLKQAEGFVNQINLRAKQDLITASLAELKNAELQMKKEAQALAEFQKNKNTDANLAEYQQILINNTVAKQQFEAATLSLRNAQVEITKKQLYLERIEQPSLSDASFKPSRIYNIISTFIITLLIYGILNLLFAGIREHKD
jgi:Capsule polysaccharide export protein